MARVVVQVNSFKRFTYLLVVLTAFDPLSLAHIQDIPVDIKCIHTQDSLFSSPLTIDRLAELLGY
jgi:hypothetical protein